MYINVLNIMKVTLGRDEHTHTHKKKKMYSQSQRRSQVKALNPMPLSVAMSGDAAVERVGRGSCLINKLQFSFFFFFWLQFQGTTSSSVEDKDNIYNIYNIYIFVYI